MVIILSKIICHRILQIIDEYSLNKNQTNIHKRFNIYIYILCIYIYIHICIYYYIQ